MADIKDYLKKIEESIRGEDVRDAVIKILELVNSDAHNAYTLNGHYASYFATQDDFEKLLPIAQEAILGNTKPISSGGVYNIIAKIVDKLAIIIGESSSDDITTQLGYLNNVKSAIRNSIISKQVDISTTAPFSEYAEAIKNIPINAEISVQPITINKNGEYEAKPGQAYNPITVEVNPTLSKKNITKNGKYKSEDDEVDGYSEVEVDVKPKLMEKTIDKAGTFRAKDEDTDDDPYDGYSKVIVKIEGLDEDEGGTSPKLKVGSKTITKDGTYTAKDDSLLGYSSVKVDVGSTLVTLEESIPSVPGTEMEYTPPDDIVGWNKVHITLTEATGFFQVRFMDNNTPIWIDAKVPAYGDAKFEGEVPTREGKTFIGWNPSPNNVTNNIDCYAQFSDTPPDTKDEIVETWEAIIKNPHGYSIGAHKKLHIGPFTYDGVQFPGTSLTMYKVCEYSSEDSKTVWMSKESLTSNLGVTGLRYYTNLDTDDIDSYSGWSTSNMRDFLNGALVTAISNSKDDKFNDNMSHLVGGQLKPSPQYTREYNIKTGALGTVTTQDKIWVPSARQLGYGNYSWLKQLDYVETAGSIYEIEKSGIGGIGAGPTRTVFQATSKVVDGTRHISQLNAFSSSTYASPTASYKMVVGNWNVFNPGSSGHVAVKGATEQIVPICFSL